MSEILIHFLLAFKLVLIFNKHLILDIVCINYHLFV